MAQNGQPTAQPAWLEMQMVVRAADPRRAGSLDAYTVYDAPMTSLTPNTTMMMPTAATSQSPNGRLMTRPVQSAASLPSEPRRPWARRNECFRAWRG